MPIPDDCCDGSTNAGKSKRTYNMYTKTDHNINPYGGFGSENTEDYKLTDCNDITLYVDETLTIECNYSTVICMWYVKLHSDEHCRVITQRYLDEKEKTFILEHNELVKFINIILNEDKTNDINAIKQAILSREF